jgi:hypothetical protein
LPPVEEFAEFLNHECTALTYTKTVKSVGEDWKLEVDCVKCVIVKGE